MIFDRIAPDRVRVDPCVPLGSRLARAAAESLNHPAEAVKRKIAGRRDYIAAHPTRPALIVEVAQSVLHLARGRKAAAYAHVLEVHREAARTGPAPSRRSPRRCVRWEGRL